MPVRKLKYTCIVCPQGCEIEVVISDNEIKEIKGFKCIRGKRYVTEEVLAPKRTLITVLHCKNGDYPTVSVKTSKPIPKEKMFEILEYLSKIVLEAPVDIGDIVIRNIFDSGVDIIATRPCRKV
ncbi:MAG: DUF1667 domain-containing protein [Thermoproteales archaeon]|nr:DUF1667 domain-containing protein [Thermoproteales archaeon]